MTLEQGIKALALAEIRQVSELKRKQIQQQCSASACKQNGATPRHRGHFTKAAADTRNHSSKDSDWTEYNKRFDQR